MAVSFNVRKMFSNIETMDGCKNSEETVIVPLNERIVGTLFFKINILLLKELLKQQMTAASSVKINTLFVTKTDIRYFK